MYKNKNVIYQSFIHNKLIFKIFNSQSYLLQCLTFDLICYQHTFFLNIIRIYTRCFIWIHFFSSPSPKKNWSFYLRALPIKLWLRLQVVVPCFKSTFYHFSSYDPRIFRKIFRTRAKLKIKSKYSVRGGWYFINHVREWITTRFHEWHAVLRY